MKVTRLGPPHPIMNAGLGLNAGGRVPTGGLDLQVLTSDGSNGRYWGENIRRITSNGSNTLLGPDVNFVSGANMLFAVASNTLTLIATGGSTPGPHAASHEDGGSDEIDVTGLTGAGGSGSSRPFLDTFSAPLDGTYGDDFDEASLNARWTRKNITAGMETYQSANGSWLRTEISSATVAQQYQQTLPGSGDWDFIAAMTYFRQDASGTMVGLVAYDASGNGRGPVCYIQDRTAYHGVIASFLYSSHAGALVDFIAPSGKKIWYRLTKVGTTYTARVSQDGYNWSRAGATAVDATAYTLISVGRYLGSNTDDVFCIDLFDRVS